MLQVRIGFCNLQILVSRISIIYFAPNALEEIRINTTENELKRVDKYMY